MLHCILYVKFFGIWLSLNTFVYHIFVEAGVFAVENSPYIVGIPTAALHTAVAVVVEARQGNDSIFVQLHCIYLRNNSGHKHLIGVNAQYPVVGSVAHGNIFHLAEPVEIRFAENLYVWILACNFERCIRTAIVKQNDLTEQA